MNPRLLADTHILIWWLTESKKLSREQIHAMRDAVRRREPVGVSAITLMEIAVLFGYDRTRIDIQASAILNALDSSPGFQVIPITVEVAAEIAAVGSSLRDPVDRTIVCTARVHGLRLITSDERIIRSRLVPVVE